MRALLLRALLLVYVTYLSVAQQPIKTPISDQEILAVLGKQPQPDPQTLPSVPVPVPLPEQPSPKQAGRPSLNVEPLPTQMVSGADVMSRLQSACQALGMFISQSEQMQRYLHLMPPGLMPWLYAMKLGFPVDCGFSSYSNALNVFSTACSVFDRCPLPFPLGDVEGMFSNVSTGQQMASQFQGGFRSPGVQMPGFIPQIPQQSFQAQHLPIPQMQGQFVPVLNQPPAAMPAPTATLSDQPVLIGPMPMQPVPPPTVPLQPAPVKPRASVMPAPSEPIPVKPMVPIEPVRSLPGTKMRGRKVQVQAQQIRIPKTSTMSGGQQNQPRVQVITKIVPAPPKKAPPSVPRPVAVRQPQLTMVPQRTFPRMPIPSMGSFYPLWFYGFQQGPTVGNVGRPVRPTTTPTPRQSDHDHSD